MSNDNQKHPTFTDEPKNTEEVQTSELSVEELEERIAPVSLGIAELEDRIAPARIV